MEKGLFGGARRLNYRLSKFLILNSKLRERLRSRGFFRPSDTFPILGATEYACRWQANGRR